MAQVQISVIVCSVQDPSWKVHEKNIAQTIGVDYEYLRVDNRGNPRSLAGAYQFGLEQACGEICVFVHEDVFFLEPNWGQCLLQKFRSQNSLGALGVAGASLILPEFPAWFKAGRPWIHGRVLHQNPSTGEMLLCHYSPKDRTLDQSVQVLDGLLICAQRDLALQVGWDAQTFQDFHLYDMDFSLRMARKASVQVTQDLLVVHLSAGNFGQKWWQEAEKFTLKHLPLLQSLQEQNSWNGVAGAPYECEDLTGILSPLKFQ